MPTTTPATYTAADITRATRRCGEVREAHPTWPQSRVRATVAREMGVSTVGLRYLLRQGAAAV
ncbi:MAG: hypothetical protein ACRYFX_12930 [Janthinobacterium lividum]